MTARRAIPCLAVLASVAAAAPAAGAPSVSIPDRCNQARKPVDFAGAGFRAGARYVAVVSGRVVARGTVSRFGDLSGSFSAPRPTRSGPGERTFTLAIETSRTERATARFTSTVFGADFRPAAQGDDPATLRVRFYAVAFGLGKTVYLHYVRPNRRLRRTVLLGRTRAPCGTLVTPPRRIFPFPAETGDWRLQFDTTQRYDSTPAPPFVRIIQPVVRVRR
jgi:hypothetical protein